MLAEVVKSVENQHQSLALLSTLELTQDQYLWKQKYIRICENYASDGNKNGTQK